MYRKEVLEMFTNIYNELDRSKFFEIYNIKISILGGELWVHLEYTPIKIVKRLLNLGIIEVHNIAEYSDKSSYERLTDKDKEFIESLRDAEDWI